MPVRVFAPALPVARQTWNMAMKALLWPSLLDARLLVGFTLLMYPHEAAEMIPARRSDQVHAGAATRFSNVCRPDTEGPLPPAFSPSFSHRQNRDPIENASPQIPKISLDPPRTEFYTSFAQSTHPAESRTSFGTGRLRISSFHFIGNKTCGLGLKGRGGEICRSTEPARSLTAH